MVGHHRRPVTAEMTRRPWSYSCTRVAGPPSPLGSGETGPHGVTRGDRPGTGRPANFNEAGRFFLLKGMTAMQTETTGPKPPWLTMLYMAGDNNLTEEMVLALQDLVAEGAAPGSAIKAQFDPSGEGFDTQRYTFDSVRHAALEGHRDKTFAGGEINAGSPEALVDFVRWAADGDYQAMRYALVLSGHGAGTSDDFLMRDENSRDALSMKELQEALDKATSIIRQSSGDPNRKLDILGFDACFMSMGEVALEARDYADILVGAEGMEPAFGWPYRRLIAKAKERARGRKVTRLPRTSRARSSRSTSRTITTSTAPPGDRRIWPQSICESWTMS